MNTNPPSQSQIDYGCAVEVVDSARSDKYAKRIVVLILVVAIALSSFTLWAVVR